MKYKSYGKVDNRLKKFQKNTVILENDMGR